jgi:isopenicillin-N epimerase
MRDLFLLDPEVVFLNHGSFGACPREVFDALQRWQMEMERNPVQFLGRRSAGLLADARERLAQYLGASAAHLVFVPNATTGVNIVARSLQLKPGDEVLTTDHEYGACDATWQRLCAAAGARYRAVRIPLPIERENFAERLLAAVGPRTKMIFASHVTSTTALTFPLAELCRRARERGVPTLIDGAHAPGQIALNLDALGADFYTGNCHKWMCAPKGAAFLHARPEHHDMLDAPVTSWGYAAEAGPQHGGCGPSPATAPAQAGAVRGPSGHTGFDAYIGHTTLERRLQWQGTRDIASFLSVPAAIDFQARHDWPSVRQRCHDLAVRMLHRVSEHFGLAPIGRDDDFAQMVPLRVPPQDAEGLRRRLFDGHRIEVPVTQHDGHTFVRMSVQGYTTEADVEALWQALTRPT